MVAEANEKDWEQAKSWIEAELQGEVINARGQGRWRAAWFFDLQRDGETLPMYFRGHRPGLGEDTRRLVLEMNILKILQQHGLPVPYIYGLCPAPEGIVMECKPGRPNLATLDNAADREKILDQYVDALVAMHAIDTREFEAIGMSCPNTVEERGLADLAQWEAIYRKHKYKPEPLIEFVTQWLKNNVPEDRHDNSFLHVDAGQFIFAGDRLSAMLDFELSILGDPAADLAGLRTRDLSEPLGDIRRAYRRYSDKTGKTIDMRVIDYHTIRFSLMTPMPIAALCAFPPPRVNLPQYLGWKHVYSGLPIELIARLEGVELNDAQLPKEVISRYSPSHKTLRGTLDALLHECEDPDLSYELDIAARSAEYLQRVDAMGGAIDADDFEDVCALLGSRPNNWQEAEAALEAFVLSSGHEHIAVLLNYFHRHTQRQLALLGPTLRELEGSRVQIFDDY